MWIHATLLTICLGAAALLAGHGARAEQPAAMPNIQQLELTPDMVKRFVKSFGQIKALGMKYKSESAAQDPSSDSPIGAVSSFMSNREARSEVGAILKENGFSDFQQWSRVGQSVGIAYGFAKSDRSPGELQSQAEHAIGLIQQNKRFSDQQKKQMIALMRQQMGAMTNFRPLPANVELIRSMMDEIAPVMDSD